MTNLDINDFNNISYSSNIPTQDLPNINDRLGKDRKNQINFNNINKINNNIHFRNSSNLEFNMEANTNPHTPSNNLKILIPSHSIDVYKDLEELNNINKINKINDSEIYLNKNYSEMNMINNNSKNNFIQKDLKMNNNRINIMNQQAQNIQMNRLNENNNQLNQMNNNIIDKTKSLLEMHKQKGNDMIERYREKYGKINVESDSEENNIENNEDENGNNSNMDEGEDLGGIEGNKDLLFSFAQDINNLKENLNKKENKIKEMNLELHKLREENNNLKIVISELRRNLEVISQRNSELEKSININNNLCKNNFMIFMNVENFQILGSPDRLNHIKEKPEENYNGIIKPYSKKKIISTRSERNFNFRRLNENMINNDNEEGDLFMEKINKQNIIEKSNRNNKKYDINFYFRSTKTIDDNSNDIYNNLKLEKEFNTITSTVDDANIITSKQNEKNDYKDKTSGSNSIENNDQKSSLENDNSEVNNSNNEGEKVLSIININKNIINSNRLLKPKPLNNQSNIPNIHNSNSIDLFTLNKKIIDVASSNKTPKNKDFTNLLCNNRSKHTSSSQEKPSIPSSSNTLTMKNDDSFINNSNHLPLNDRDSDMKTLKTQPVEIIKSPSDIFPQKAQSKKILKMTFPSKSILSFNTSSQKFENFFYNKTDQNTNFEKNFFVNGTSYLQDKNDLFILTGSTHNLFYVYYSLKNKIVKLENCIYEHNKGTLIKYNKLFNNKIILISGKGTKNVEWYDIKNNKWSELPEVGYCRSECGCMVFNDNFLFVLFGYDYVRHRYLDNIEYFNMNNCNSNSYMENKWGEINIDLKIKSFICFKSNISIFIFGGIFDNFKNNDEVICLNINKEYNSEGFQGEINNESEFRFNDNGKVGLHFKFSEGVIEDELDNGNKYAIDEKGNVHMFNLDNMEHKIFNYTGNK